MFSTHPSNTVSDVIFLAPAPDLFVGLCYSRSSSPLPTPSPHFGCFWGLPCCAWLVWCEDGSADGDTEPTCDVVADRTGCGLSCWGIDRKSLSSLGSTWTFCFFLGSGFSLSSHKATKLCFLRKGVEYPWHWGTSYITWLFWGHPT